MFQMGSSAINGNPMITESNLMAAPTYPSLQHQVAIITGGGSGIGHATALRLATSGVHVVIADCNSNAVQRTLHDIGAATAHLECYPPALGIVSDVRSEIDMSEMVSQTLNRFGQIDILVTCAGILRPRGIGPKLLSETMLAEWDEVLDTNLKGVFLANQKVLRVMIPRRRGAIINLSSISGREGNAYDAAYCASKFAIIGMTEALAEEMQQYNIHVTALLPHAVRTPLWKQNGPIDEPRMALEPERVADFIVYMLALPEDTVLVNPVIAPLRARRRKSGHQ